MLLALPLQLAGLRLLYAIPSSPSIITSFIFTCGTRRTGRALDSAGNSTWAFDFQYFPSDSPFAYLGAIHGTDLAYFMGLGPFNASQQALSNVIQQYLVNFVVNGNPNIPAGNSGPSLVPWPLYNASQGIYLEFGSGAPDDTTVNTIVEPFGQICDTVWDRLIPILSFTPLSSA